MKYKVNDAKSKIGGSLVGYIDISYKELKDRLGQPVVLDDYKSDAEWVIEFEDGTVAWIYNYKDGKNYNGASGTPKTQIRDWHIGGATGRSRELVHQLFGVSQFERVKTL